MSSPTVLNIATNVKCPNCHRKLCKIRDYNGVPLVEVKHKDILVLATEAIIGCVDRECKKTYRVNAETTLVEEIELGRRQL